jgi:hypothetical protein
MLLNLQVHVKGSTFLNLIGLALPSLEHLTVNLSGADLGDGGLITGLQQCSYLSVLSINSFTITPAAVKPLASTLARLQSLRDLGLSIAYECDTDPAGLVAQLTGLTALDFTFSNGSGFKDVIAAAAGNPELQVFRVCSGSAEPGPAELRHLLTSCALLTELELGCDVLSQDVLEVVLMYGTNITSFTTCDIKPTTSLANRPCKWENLHIYSDGAPKLLLLANLPLHSVTYLQIGHSNFNLALPLGSVPVGQLPSLLHRAASNLAASPAWRAEPSACMSLHCDHDDKPPAGMVFSPEQRVRLLEAVAPLGGPHVTTFRNWFAGAIFEWGRPEIEALAHSLNSTRLTAMELNTGNLSVGFWAALDEKLPSHHCASLKMSHYRRSI